MVFLSDNHSILNIILIINSKRQFLNIIIINIYELYKNIESISLYNKIICILYKFLFLDYIYIYVFKV